MLCITSTGTRVDLTIFNLWHWWRSMQMEEFEAREALEGEEDHDAPNEDPGTEEDPDAPNADSDEPPDEPNEDADEDPGDPDPGDPPPDVRAAMQRFARQEAAWNAHQARADELELAMTRTIPLPMSR